MTPLRSALRLALAAALLTACNGSPSGSPATADAPATPAASAPDTTRKARAAGPSVPFVSPSKVGRVLGSQSPSPPASRTR